MLRVRISAEVLAGPLYIPESAGLPLTPSGVMGRSPRWGTVTLVSAVWDAIGAEPPSFGLVPRQAASNEHWRASLQILITHILSLIGRNSISPCRGLCIANPTPRICFDLHCRRTCNCLFLLRCSLSISSLAVPASGFCILLFHSQGFWLPLFYISFLHFIPILCTYI